jgi:DNA-binding transcriptional ArsR family regulator
MVGLTVWRLAKLKRRLTVELTAGRAQRLFRIHPTTFRRGLSGLESAGLVEVERRQGAAAAVTVIPIAGEEEWTRRQIEKKR